MATLNLPDGLSLAKTKSGQSMVQSMGNIRGQETSNASWIIKADKSGSYKVSALFEGTLMPFDTKVSASFETENEFEVYTGEGIHIYVMPENRAYDGEDYYIQFAIANESPRSFYNFSTTIGSYKEGDYECTVTDIYTGEVYTEKQKEIFITDPSDVSQSVVVRDGHTLKFACLDPGDVYYGTYVGTFIGAPNMDDDNIYYELAESLVTVMKGENTGVEITVEPIEAHINRYSYGYVEVPSLYGDPIDMTSGYFTDEVPAFVLNGGAQLSLNMRYLSGLNDKVSDLGYGWYHDYEMWLEQKGGILYLHTSPYATYGFLNKKALEGNLYGSVAGEQIVLAEGQEYTYGEYQALSRQMEDVSLNRNADGTYTITYDSGVRYGFDSTGRLNKMSDREGLEVTLTYGENQTIIQEGYFGKKIYLNYDGSGRLISVSDDNERKTTFSYDELGRMVMYSNPVGEAVTYTYDDKNRILTEANSQGVFVRNEYDEAGRVIRQTDATGGVQMLSYQNTEGGGMIISITDANDAHKQVIINADGQICKVVNENGGTTEYSYNADGKEICEKDSYGNCIFREYDADGNLVKLTDTGNLTTTMTYDDRGNVTAITNAGGQTAHYSYNERNQMVASTNYGGQVTTYEYNEAGQPVKQVIEGLGTVAFTYENGMLSSVTDYMGNTTYSTYDGAGNLIKTVDALGNATTYTYDKAGRMLSATDSMGNTTVYTYDCNNNVTSMTDGAGNKTVYTYDRAGRQTGVTYPDGTATRYEYDAMGYNTAVLLADGTKNTYTYDAGGNVVKETLADGTEFTYAYDLLNQRVSETDKNGRTVKYEYYPNGNPYKVTYPDGTYELYTYNRQWKVASVKDTAGYVTTYEYDAMGNPTMQRDAMGNTCHYTYDTFGRLVKSTDPNGNSTTYAYDANGNCIRTTDALGHSTYMEYDALNRMVRAYRKDKAGAEYSIRYTYDALGRVDSVTDEMGNTSHMAYDSLGNIISVTDAKGIITAVSEYDSMGRVTAITDAMGLTTTYTYDRMGNLLQAVEQLNGQSDRVTSYSYDTLGRLIQVTDPLAGVTEACYDGSGNVKSITDANGGTTSYTYDEMGRLLTETTPIGSRYSYTYNTQGLLKELENARGQKTTYTYDAIGRVSSMTDELGTVSYTYDNNGNVLTVTDKQGTISRIYDALNRVTEYTDYKGNTVKYGYDELGNLISLTYPGGEIVRYTYYKNGLLKTVTDASGKITSYEYDAGGNLTRTVRPNGTEEICTYNAAGLLVEQKDVKGEEVLTHYTYTYDGYGNITTIEGTETTDTEEGISKLVSASMTYDADNRLLTYNGEELKYDTDGNMTYGPVDGVMSELVYDCRNRLISAGGITYTYDAENIRIKAETDEYVEEYVTDTVSASLSRVLTMTVYDKHNGKMDTVGTTTVYLYGQGLISEKTEGTYLYHHYNNLGSTMKLTDSEGQVIESYTYGVYGELLSGDSTRTHFLYNGRCGVSTEANGLYYMRQRYYNPDIKRFINQDILTGSLDNSQSLNQYSYVQGNPVSYTDPFGLAPTNGLYTNSNTNTGMSGWHKFLLGASFIPVIGNVFSGIDAFIYAVVDKDYGSAAACVADIFAPGAFFCASVGTYKLLKAVKVTDIFADVVRGISKANSFLTKAGSKVDDLVRLAGNRIGNGIRKLSPVARRSAKNADAYRVYRSTNSAGPMEYNLQFFGSDSKKFDGRKLSGKVAESGKTTGQASKADFIVTPKGTVMDTSMDYNLVSTTTPTNQGGEFFQIHNSHPHKGNTPHTHKQQVNTNPVTGVSSSKRIDNPTTAVDIDYADSVLRSGTMRIRINIDDVGGY